MASPVSPLRIQKTSMASAIPRPLSELGPTERRRNSPSFNQATKSMLFNKESSPFQSSPYSPGENTASTRMFWQGRDNASRLSTEKSLGARDGSPSPHRRSSIERLQRASRVKNSSMFARQQNQEYDPSSLPVERPLAKPAREFGHQKSDSQSNIPAYSPNRHYTSPIKQSSPRSPARDQGSPYKSSLSSRTQKAYDPENAWYDDMSGDERELPPGRRLHRHAKSVTFDAAPPQINEYEMVTPDLSSVGTGSREGSFESEEDDEDYYGRSDSLDREDSFDDALEDTARTPVVGPDDWRYMSPSARSDSVADSQIEDPFGGPESSPMPDINPSGMAQRQGSSRNGSLNSNGESRPLPPLPGMGHARMGSASSNNADRSPSGQRSLPVLPPKSDSPGINGHALEERLQQMKLQEDSYKAMAEQQRERRMRRAGNRTGQTPEREVETPTREGTMEQEDTLGELSALGDYQLPPKISRESILRRVKGQDTLDGDSDHAFSSPPPSQNERRTPPDPDVPLPSTESDDMDTDDEETVVIKEEPEDEDIDLYALPEAQLVDTQESDYESYDSDSTPLAAADVHETQPHEQAEPEPEPTSPAQKPSPKRRESARHKLPDFSNFMDDDDFGHGLQSYMSPPTPRDIKQFADPEIREPEEFMESTPDKASKPAYDGSGWGSEEYESEGTPESVIHHPVSYSPPRDSPVVPDHMATIRSASGSKLKTRPSLTPSDIGSMRDARRHISGEIPVPPIPEKHLNRQISGEHARLSLDDLEVDRRMSFKKKSLTLDIGDDLGLSLDQDFDRVIEAQKRGYLMRQNTKLVVASSDVDRAAEERGVRSAGNSPVKERPQSWTVEPWNPQRRKSSVSKRRPPPTNMPPLPGHSTNAIGLGILTEEPPAAADALAEDPGERGRLFVKVLGIKDLDLPLPKTERTWFSLTLDNGVHCVTTAWLELGRNAPIGQEFELVVPNELEFQLTLNVKLDKPVARRAPESPSKSAKPQKTSTWGRVFGSPKKRKELENRMREEERREAEERQKEEARLKSEATAWDLISPLAAEDGSFARSYVCLKDHEASCYGRSYKADVACFNEWATEEVPATSSMKMKRAAPQVQRRAPYKIGKLELQLLFVPKPNGASDDDMPKSMNACIREMKEAEAAVERTWEGHLSQQGGDCPYWRRRYFKLDGAKLTAYHESTRQPRATINLSNASKLIDDRRVLTQKETTGKNGSRRKSGFAEEEEGYMFVEEGFRIRFKNGEVIDFYADSAADKEGWMKVLDMCIGKGALNTNWCNLVLKREADLRQSALNAPRFGHSRIEPRARHQKTRSMVY